MNNTDFYLKNQFKKYISASILSALIIFLAKILLDYGMKNNSLNLSWSNAPDGSLFFIRTILIIFIQSSLLYTIFFSDDSLIDNSLKIKVRVIDLYLLFTLWTGFILDYFTTENNIYISTILKFMDYLTIAVLIYTSYNAKKIYVYVYNVIQSERRLAEEFHKQSITDKLTGLPNRACFSQHLSQVIKHGRESKFEFAVIFLDLDRFKFINDTFGHSEGDFLINNVGKRLKTLEDEDKILYRLGGDEFTFILRNLSGDIQELEEFCQNIINLFNEPFTIHGQEIYITASIGISRFPYDGTEDDILIKNADSAMYKAKESGKNKYQFYDNSMNDTILLRLYVENAMRKAIEKDEFIIHYQPEVDIKSNKIIAAEALLRWKHPILGMVPPGVFIPIAEETGLIVDIGKWVIYNVCTQNKLWCDKGLCKIPIGVNISARQFTQSNLDETVNSVLNETGLESRFLELELTESIVMENADLASDILNKFKDINISIAIDDFGTGYSSLSYLRKFPINKLKIDRSFINEIPNRQEDALIVKAIIALGHSLGLNVIAEGVEKDEQVEFLNSLDCDAIQGYKYSPPVSAKNFENLIIKYNKGTLK